MKNKSSFVLAALSVFGLGGQQVTSIAPQIRAEQQQEIAAVKNGASLQRLRGLRAALPGFWPEAMGGAVGTVW